MRVRRGPATVTGKPTQAARCGVTGPINRAGKAGQTVEARSQETCHRHGLIRFAEGGMSRGCYTPGLLARFFCCLSETTQLHLAGPYATGPAVPTDTGGPTVNRLDPDSVEISKVGLGLAGPNSRQGGRTAPSRRCKVSSCAAGLCSRFGDSQQAGPATLPSMTQILKHTKGVPR